MNWYKISKENKKKKKIPKDNVIGPYIIDPEGMPPGEYYDAGGYLQLANNENKDEIVKESSDSGDKFRNIEDDEYKPSLADEKGFDESMSGDSQTEVTYTVTTSDKLKLGKDLAPVKLDKDFYEFLIDKGMEETIEVEDIFDSDKFISTTCQQYNAEMLIDFLNPFLSVLKEIDEESKQNIQQLKDILRIAYYADKTRQSVLVCLKERFD